MPLRTLLILISGIYTRIRLSGEARKVFEGSYDTANFQS